MSDKIQQQIMNGRALRAGTIVSVGVVLIMALIVVFNSFTVVDAGTRGVVKTFGEVTGVFEEGLHFRTPLVTSVVPVDVKTRRYESNSSAASRDLQIVTTQVVLNYHPDPAAVGTLVRDIGTDYEPKVIDPAIQESVKAATARFTAEELITQRPLVSESIKDVLGTRLIPRGIIVEDLSITEFNFSPEFSKAIEAKQVAEQDALRAERELRRVQIEAQQQVAQADAQAEARLKVARAEAEALRLQREVISPALLQLRFIEKWDGVLPRFSAGDTGMIPLVSIPQEELQEAQSQATPTDEQAPASLEMEAPAAPETRTTP